jgi:hypothetical protein
MLKMNLLEDISFRITFVNGFIARKMNIKMAGRGVSFEGRIE